MASAAAPAPAPSLRDHDRGRTPSNFTKSQTTAYSKLSRIIEHSKPQCKRRETMSDPQPLTGEKERRHRPIVFLPKPEIIFTNPVRQNGV